MRALAKSQAGCACPSRQPTLCCWTTRSFLSPGPLPCASAGLNESGSDADEEGGSSSEDEADISSEMEPAAAAGPQTAAGATNTEAEAPDSDIDAGLDELGHQSATTSNSSSVDEDLSDPAATSSHSSSDDEDDPSISPGSKQQQHVSFFEGGKSASFAKAFTKIMSRSSKAAATNAAAPADVILSESASMAKRKAEVDADAAAAREAKRQRLELKTRGHLVSPAVLLHPMLFGRAAQLLAASSSLLPWYCGW